MLMYTLTLSVSIFYLTWLGRAYEQNRCEMNGIVGEREQSSVFATNSKSPLG